MSFQRTGDLEGIEYTTPSFTFPATVISPFESAASVASLLSALSILNSETPSLGDDTAMPTTTRPYSITPSSSSMPSPYPAAESIFGTTTTSNDPYAATPTPSSTPLTASPTPTLIITYGNPNGNDNNNGGWDGMGHGTHAGVVMAGIIGIVLTVVLSFWFCCGGRAWWARKHDRNLPHPLPLYNIQNPQNTQAGVNRTDDRGAAGLGGDAPPVYAEVAPPQHQSLARGRRADEVLEDDAVVSDGKMPVSEMVFEDVVLERHPSESSSSRNFEEHHAMGGDTRGHTNT